jgi:predicted enzyme related to lactoylglutathione lyase
MSASAPLRGRFVWYELMTPDKDAARVFYGALFGWDWHIEDMGEHGLYPMARTGEHWHGGLITPQGGMPPCWIAYVAVDDVDAACALAPELGGAVLEPGADIPGVGRFAVLQDPGGAVILPFTGANPPAAETPHPAPAGFFCWNELLTPDPALNVDFYTEIFGYDVQDSEMPGMGAYWVLTRGDRMEAGMMPMPPEAGAPPHWLPYIAVDDLDASAARVAELGGAVHLAPTDIPGMGRFAVVADPQGAVFAMFQAA